MNKTLLDWKILDIDLHLYCKQPNERNHNSIGRDLQQLIDDLDLKLIVKKK